MTEDPTLTMTNSNTSIFTISSYRNPLSQCFFYWLNLVGSGYESEDSSGNEVDCDSSGAVWLYSLKLLIILVFEIYID